MINLNQKRYYLVILAWIIFGCSDSDPVLVETNPEELTIFFVNDMHGELVNFAKIKHIVDAERLETNVLVVSGGDIFSGNPVVDNYPQKGFPIIDVMNKVGFDISVIGNHEFDYGPEALKDRMQQANFEWVCANVDMGTSGVPEPNEYKTLTVNDIKVTFLGLVETSGRGNIPLTHPWRVRNIDFSRPETVVNQYSNLKEQENADLLIALTHLGHSGRDGALGDFQLAEQFPFFDMIIGGHSNELLNTTVNDIPVFQAGNDLNFLGKVEITIKDKVIQSIKHDLINLDTYSNSNAQLAAIINDYESNPVLDEVIGFSNLEHDRSEVGCFYTDALRGQLNADVSFQNSGGIRASLNQGDINRREIYEIDPFNNGTITYSMTVQEIKDFLKGSQSGLYYSGIVIDQVGNEIIIEDMQGNEITNETSLKVGINDFIPAIFDEYFPENGTSTPLTTAETIISYLEGGSENVAYPDCERFFRYN